MNRQGVKKPHKSESNIFKNTHEVLSKMNERPDKLKSRNGTNITDQDL